MPLGLHMAAQSFIWLPTGLHMAAQRLHLAAEGVALCCTGAVYGSHAADMQHMLHLAGPGWAARILRPRQVRGSWAVWGL